MGKLVRSIGAVIAGFIAASVIMMAIEWLNGHVLYPDLGKLAAGMTDREAIRALMASAPFGAFLVVLLGWALGSLLGGFVAGWIGWHAPARHALILGGVLTLAGVANNLMIPPPTWFWIVSVFVFLPTAYLGGGLAPRRMPATA